MKGIDVSSHNGNINWSLVRNDGVEVVYIKATEGTTYEDPYLNNHYNGAKAAGLKTGFYHFLVGSSVPETQAENFYNHIKDKENDLLTCLDIEHSDNEPSNFMDYTLRFINRFKELSGIDICIYSGPFFINENLDSRLESYPLWVAHYGVDKPMNNNVWGSSYAGHQYTETGSVEGILGNVDINRFNEGILNNHLENRNIINIYNSKNIYAELQRELNRQGFRDKNGNELVVDGIPGELTLSACPIVKEGARGEITRWIQLRIGTEADGVFGGKTKQNIVRYQSKNGLWKDGIVGRNTWKKLFSII